MMPGIILFNRNAFFPLIQVYKDLVAVTSTSEFVFIKLLFIEMAIKESFYDFLLNHLEFTKTTEFAEEQSNEDDTQDVMNKNSRMKNIF